jgi:hypothetical protein
MRRQVAGLSRCHDLEKHTVKDAVRRLLLPSVVVCLVFLLPLQSPGEDRPNPSSTGKDAHPDEEKPTETYTLPERLKRALPTIYERQGDYTIIPLPAIAYNRNESYYFGTVVPILKSNAQDHVESIFAPQYLWNQYVGSALTLNYYKYPSDSSQFYIVASQSEKIAQNFDLFYKDMGAGNGRFIIMGQVNFFKNPFQRFFGFGNAATQTNETNYTDREFLVKGTIGLNITPDFYVTFTERYREVRVDNGILPSLPMTKQQFPNLAGIAGAKILGHRLSLAYDTRDNLRTPTQGTYATFSLEYNQNLSHDESENWWRWTVDARTLIPHGNGRLVFVPRIFVDTIIGNKQETDLTLSTNSPNQLGIPFYERPTLGGDSTLRAFGYNRYISNTAILLNLEERIQVLERKVFSHNVGLEIAPFLDLGRVQSTRVEDKLNLRNWQINPGTSFRFLARPDVVCRADFAYGRDGANAFVGIDYPF